jgi:hypothetical protein
VRPSMLTAKGSVLIGISSPYAKRGLLYEKHRDHFGRDGSRILVWQADTATMNRAADRDEIEQAYEDDPQAASAEFGAQFRDDISAFLDADMLGALTRPSPLELPPRDNIRYRAFVDPSGGRGDAFTMAIGHLEGKVAVVDVLRARQAPFDPAEVVQEFAAVLRQYRVTEVKGDGYSAEWAAQAFKAEGRWYRPSERFKSQIYLESLPLFAQGVVELPPDRRLLVELASLERRTARNARDSVDHPRGAHDDRANSTCGVLVEVAAMPRSGLVQQRLLGV